MRVLLVIRSLEYGGANRQIIILAKGLRASGHDASIAVFYPGGVFEDECIRAGVPLHVIRKKGRWEVVGFVVRFVRFVRRMRPDVVHSYLELANDLSALFKPLFRGARVVWGLRMSELDLSRYDRLRRFLHIVERRLARKADRVIVNSKEGERHALTWGVPSRRLIVIPNGIDTDMFRPEPSLRQPLREGWGVPRDALVIGNVARLDPMKDHHTFLEAAALISKDFPSAWFVCVGGGASELASELKATAVSLGVADRVVWTGFVDRPGGVYSAFDVFTLSSAFGEGFPNVVAEAMANELPCVVTDVGDSAWVVGDCGVVVPPRNAGALADGWARAMDFSEEDRRAARSRVVSEFSTERLIRRTESALAP